MMRKVSAHEAALHPAKAVSIEALIIGRLDKPAERRSTASGSQYVTTRVQIAFGDAAAFVRVVAFGELVQAALLALQGGDTVALSGSLKVGAWIDLAGAPRVNLDLVASVAMTAYGVAKKCLAVAAAAGSGDVPALPSASRPIASAGGLRQQLAGDPPPWIASGDDGGLHGART